MIVKKLSINKFIIFYLPGIPKIIKRLCPIFSPTFSSASSNAKQRYRNLLEFVRPMRSAPSTIPPVPHCAPFRALRSLADPAPVHLSLSARKIYVVKRIKAPDTIHE